MERQEILIQFAQLRQLAASVPAYLAERAGEATAPMLRMKLENDLSLMGDDLIETITEFAETYRVDVAAFDFTGLISPEGFDSTGPLLFLLQVAYLLVGGLLKAMLGLGWWSFDSHLAKHIWQQPLPRFWRPTDEQPQPKPLTIGDFVASAAVGRFVRREQVFFQLVR